MCSAGWFDRGHVGYPIVKAGAHCGFGKIGIIDYGYRINKSEKWDVFCFNPDSEYTGMQNVSVMNARGSLGVGF